MVDDRLDRIERKLDTLTSGQGALQTDATELKAGQSALRDDVADLKAGQSALHGDVTDLKAGQSALRGDVADLKSGQSALRGDVADLKSGQSALRGDVADLKASVTRIETRLDKVEVGQEEMSDNIKQIAEGHAATQAAIERAAETVCRYIDRRVKPLENLVRERLGTN